MDAAARKTLFSSALSEWETPPEIFDPLHREFRFTLDVCATAANAKCSNWIDQETDALDLEVPWRGRCWMNPPYGRKVGHWVDKAAIETFGTELVCCLLPSRTDVLWWHSEVMRFAAEVRFIQGRITFVGAKAPAPFPSAIVIFKSGHRGGPVFKSWRP